LEECQDGLGQASKFQDCSRFCTSQQVIKQNVENSFFWNARQDFSTGIRRNFNEIAKGLSCKDKKKLGAPTA
jgi:hypothetical protein